MTTEPLRPASSVGYQVNRLARLFEVALRNRIAAYGVVPGQFPALLALYERDQLTQRELCEIASVDQSTMAKTLARAVEADLAGAGHEVIALATGGIPAARLAAFEQTLAEMAGNLTAVLAE